MRESRYRGKRVDTGEWVYGDLLTNNGGPIIVAQVKRDYILKIYTNGGDHWAIETPAYRVIPETVGQLRHEKDGNEYYDGDVYYHAGHGNEQVSDICNLQFALYVGESQNIEHIIGNIHDNPELLKP